MALTNQASVLSAIPTLENSFFYINSVSNTLNRMAVLNKITGCVGVEGNTVEVVAVPAAASDGGTIPTNLNNGFLNFTDAPSGQYNYVHSINAIFPSTSMGTLYFKDCVWFCSGFDGTLTTVQSITSFPTLTRNPNNGSDLELWLESTTTIGTTGFNITVNYTKSDNTTNAYTQTLTSGELTNTSAVRINIPPGGIKSIQSIQLSASSGTAGNFGLCLYRPICELSQPRGTTFTIPTTRYIADWTKTGLARIENGAAIVIMLASSSSSTGAMNGSINLIKG